MKYAWNEWKRSKENGWEEKRRWWKIENLKIYSLNKNWHRRKSRKAFMHKMGTIDI